MEELIKDPRKIRYHDHKDFAAMEEEMKRMGIGIFNSKGLTNVNLSENRMRKKRNWKRGAKK